MRPALLEAIDRVHSAGVQARVRRALAPAVADMQRDAARMFSMQAWDVLNALYLLPIEEAGGEDKRQKQIIAAVVAALAARLGTDTKLLQPGLLRSVAIALEQTARRQFGVELALSDIRAEQYMAKYGAELVKGLNDVSRDTLRSLLTTDIAAGRSYVQMAQDIMGQFGQMTAYRAETIALTETSHAYSWAAMEQGRLLSDAGVAMLKQWMLSPLHHVIDACDDNALDGPLPLDAPFSAGDMGPPQHPRCWCALEVFADPDQEIPAGLTINDQPVRCGPALPFIFIPFGDRND